MRTLMLILLSLVFVPVIAQEFQEKEIESAVNEVTVFIDKAQVTRNKKIDLTRGITLLKFMNLSPFIDAKSIQVKTEGDFTILGVNHQQNFLKQPEKSEEIKNLETKIKAVNEKIQLEQAHLDIIGEELMFLQVNKNIAGQNNGLNLTTLKEVSEYYGTQLTSLKLKEIERRNSLNELEKQKREYLNQLSSISSQKEFASGEVLVKVEAKSPVKASISLSYLVDNAGWYPSYIVRANTINDPLEIVYKANVRQDTKIDWQDVKLTFSSANPSSSGVAPELRTYFLNYNSLPPVYDKTISSVSGKVTDQNNEPLPGASINVEGTTIGTITDISGNYSIMIPAKASHLTYSFIGFVPQTLPVGSAIMNVQLKEDILALDEVVVTGFSIVNDDLEVEDALQGRMAGVSVRGVSSVKPKKEELKTIPFENVEKQTNVEFEIKMPYTIESDNKSFTVDMVTYTVPVGYQYFSIPKIEEQAFLIANIIDWEQYNLLEGEANLFFENTFVGKTILDIRSASDTLQLSLGRDKNVVINREKMKEFSERQFIGSKKEETLSWNISVRNNKSQPINISVLDQVPVSANEEIEVDIQELTKGNYNKETGEIRWELNIDPQVRKEMNLRYSVKYPKWRNLVIE